ncbi:MAG: hypothetical protein ACI4PW_04555 [Alphaproteobacteria bacterium]|jgi:hypothetical protein
MVNPGVFLLMGSRGGLGGGGSLLSGPHEGRWNRDDGWSNRRALLSAYLNGDVRIDANGRESGSERFGGLGGPGYVCSDDVEERREKAVKKVNMVTPPTFLEKLATLPERTPLAVDLTTLGVSYMATSLIAEVAKARVVRMEREKGLSRQEAYEAARNRVNEISEQRVFRKDVKKLDALLKKMKKNDR